jgi:Tfp pilus assembly protein PilX
MNASDGIVMPVALIIMLILTLVGLGALLTRSMDLLTTRSQMTGKGAFYAADAAIVHGTKDLNGLLATVLVPTSAQLGALTAPSLPGFGFDTFSVVASGSTTVKTLTTGPYAGLYADSTPYTVTAQASGTAVDSGTVRLSQIVEDQLIPLFEFGIFYNEDLEILPGPCMTFNGRIHSNKNIYVAPGSTGTCSNNPTIDSRMTSAKDIYRCRKDNPSACGSAKIKKPDGTYAYLTFDHTAADWTTQAYNTWGGLVQDSAHGVQSLNLPIGTSNPMDLIKRGDTIDPATSSESATLKSSRMYWQADLRILNGLAYDKNGNDVTPSLNSAGVLLTKTFYDYRQNKPITVTEVNITNLNNCACKPANGILYVSETQDMTNSKAVRLTNGATLPAGGLTVASDNPLYLKGDYNTAVKKGAALMSDAITFLSNNWNDANAVDISSPFSTRVAASTTVNAAVVTGNTNTSVGQYNGGVENLPRFLENWTGKNFTYKGSLIDLWQSQQATAPWAYGSPIYTAPNRIWSYDTDFNDPANLPPGTPRVRTLARTQWARM